jgi:hypothetical protein
MTRLRIIWATVKGWLCPGTSVFEEVAKIGLDKVNGALQPAAMKIGKACDTIVEALRLLDKYADWCPCLWREDYDRILSVVAQIVGILEDGAVSMDELSKAADLFRIEYARWFAD